MNLDGDKYFTNIKLPVESADPPVCSHEYEGVDGDVSRDVDDILNCPTPGQTEGPEHQDVVTGRGRHTDLSRPR